jgi:hypothetical protein
MATAFIAATFYHLFNATSISNGVIGASKKAQIVIAIFFIASSLYESGIVGDRQSFSTKSVASENATKLTAKKTK